MPKFTFKGFSSGSAVALSVAQGSKSDSGSVSAWGQASMAAIDILKIEGEMVAPAGVWFEAIGMSGFDATGPGPGESYDPSFHEVTFIWDFGEKDAQGNPLVWDAALNIPDAWKNRSIAYGKSAAHVFRTPGTYTVTLWAVDGSGNIGTASTTVTIADPDTAYPGSRTICYSDIGDFAGAPAGAQLVSSVPSLVSAVSNLSQTGRILFKRGSDQTLEANIIGNQNFRVGTWGTGERPILRPPLNRYVFEISQGLRNLKFRTYDGLDFRGSWDPATETGGYYDNVWANLLSDAPNMMTVVHDCRISGMSGVNLTTLKAVDFTTILSDTIIDGWSEYGFVGNTQNDGVTDGTRIALIGTAIQQLADACNGALGFGYGDDMSNEQGPIRWGTTRRWLMRSCYVFSNTSWAGGSQPCIRVGADSRDVDEFIGDRLVLEGGNSSYQHITYNGFKTNNTLIDRFLFIGSADTQNLFDSEASGFTLRNGYGWLPPIPRRTHHESGLFKKLPSSGTLSEPVKLFNVSVLDEQSGGFTPLLSGFADFTTLTVENNFFHAATQPGGPDEGAFGITTISGVTPRYAGFRASIGRPLTTVSGVANGSSITFSYPTGQDGSTVSSAADFSPTGRHWLRIWGTGNPRFYQEHGHFTIAFNASNIVVTNTSGAAWPGGDFRLICDYLNYVTDSTYASPATVPLPRPQSGAPSYQTGNLGQKAIDDFLLTHRPGLPVAGWPAGNASKGAVEPV